MLAMYFLLSGKTKDVLAGGQKEALSWLFCMCWHELHPSEASFVNRSNRIAGLCLSWGRSSGWKRSLMCLKMDQSSGSTSGHLERQWASCGPKGFGLRLRWYCFWGLILEWGTHLTKFVCVHLLQTTSHFVSFFSCVVQTLRCSVRSHEGSWVSGKNPKCWWQVYFRVTWSNCAKFSQPQLTSMCACHTPAIVSIEVLMAFYCKCKEQNS